MKLPTVVEIETDHITADFLKPVFLNQNYNQLSLWKKPCELNKDQHRIEMQSVVPIRPVLGLSKFSTRRLVIFELSNVDLIEKFL